MLQLQKSNHSSSSMSPSSSPSTLSSSLSSSSLSLLSSLPSSSSSLPSSSPSSSSWSSDTNLPPTPETIEKEKLQKNNCQNTVKGEHARVDKENDISNVNNSSKIDENKKDQNGNNEVKSIVIIGDSMIKHLNGWDMSKKVHKSECKVYVKSFPGAKTSCMKDYVKPSLRSTPNHFILHVGTNDLNSNQTSEVIAKEIVDLATSLKNNQHDVSVSNIILRTDNSKLNAKRCEVNRILSQLCQERNMYLIDNSKKIKPNHLNKGKLHLNKNGSNILSRTFVNEISRVFNWRVADNNSSINIEGCNTSVLHYINKVSDWNNTLKSLRKGNLNKRVFTHLNLNSIRNKFELLSEQIKGTIGVLMISETKTDDSFPIGQFLIEGFCTP